MKLEVNFSDMNSSVLRSSSVHRKTDKVREAGRFGMPIIWLHPATMECLVVLALAMPRHPPKVHLGNRKWWAISDGTVGTTAGVREVLLLTLICWPSIHSCDPWCLCQGLYTTEDGTEQLEFIPLESYKMKNSGWHDENYGYFLVL